ncbi:Uma2 family endonuclease [Neolewinella sp.]|uniref:Uma2 family endonuclease n=1 Tax=Neolewinella sp. TaxID=2993543 RepID=UPI003B522EC4
MTAIPISTYEAPPTPPVAHERHPFRYSLERYHAAIEAGIFTENDAIELIFGEIIEKLPIGIRHRDCVDLITELFVLKFAGRYRCSAQNPITVLGTSEPEPDFVIFDKTSYQQHSGQPSSKDIRLLVEVSDATLDYDRAVKLKMYALAGIREYWIINLKQDQVEVHLSPVTASGDYNSIQRHPRGATFESPLCGSMSVDELLPPPKEETE